MIPLPSFAAIRLVALVAGIAAAGFGGWMVRGWKEDSTRLDAERVSHETYVKTVDAWAAGMQEIHNKRAADQQQATTDRHEFERRLKDATRPKSEPLAVCGQGLDPQGLGESGFDPAPVRSIRFTRDFVGLWNGGLSIGLPAALRASRGDGARAAARLADDD